MAHQISSFDVFTGCLALRVRRLSRLLTRLHERELRPLGLTAAQLTLLAAIDLAGPVPASKLGARLDLEKSTLSRNLARMKQAKWVSDHAGWVLSAGGKAVLADALPAWERAQEKSRKMLGPQAVGTLERMIAAVVEQEGEAEDDG
jgi:hypothetical protein